jgi:protein-disulfide isomerase
MPPVPRPGSKGRRGVDRTIVIVIAAAVAVVAALVAGSLLLRGGDDGGGNGGSTTGNTSLVGGIPQSGTVLGDPAATVTLLQYEDLQCPACLAYQVESFPTVVDEYVRTGKVKIDFRGLEFLGPDSNQALRAVLAAAEQGKAWQMIDLFYANQGDENSGWVTDVLIDELAESVGLDVEQLHTDMESAAVTEQIEAIANEAESRGVAGTPAFMVQIGDDEPYVVQPNPYTNPAEFRAILDDALQGS